MVRLLVSYEKEGRITVALVLMGFLLQYLLKFPDEIMYRKMTHVPTYSTYSKKMSLFILLHK